MKAQSPKKRKKRSLKVSDESTIEPYTKKPKVVSFSYQQGISDVPVNLEVQMPGYFLDDEPCLFENTYVLWV